MKWYDNRHRCHNDCVFSLFSTAENTVHVLVQGTGFTTKTQRDYPSKYVGRAPGCNKTVRSVENFQDRGSGESELDLRSLRH